MNGIAWLAQHGLSSPVRPAAKPPRAIDTTIPRTRQLRNAIKSAPDGLSAHELYERTGIPTNRISGLLKADMQHGRIRCDICADGRGIYSVGVQIDPREREAAEFLRRRGYVVTRRET